MQTWCSGSRSPSLGWSLTMDDSMWELCLAVLFWPIAFTPLQIPSPKWQGQRLAPRPHRSLVAGLRSFVTGLATAEHHPRPLGGTWMKRPGCEPLRIALARALAKYPHLLLADDHRAPRQSVGVRSCVTRGLSISPIECSDRRVAGSGGGSVLLANREFCVSIYTLLFLYGVKQPEGEAGV